MVYSDNRISWSNEKRLRLPAAIGLNLKNGRTDGTIQMLWGIGNNLFLDWVLVSWVFNL